MKDWELKALEHEFAAPALWADRQATKGLYANGYDAMKSEAHKCGKRMRHLLTSIERTGNLDEDVMILVSKLSYRNKARREVDGWPEE